MSHNDYAKTYLDRLEIQDVINRWLRGVDRRDWDLARSAFHPRRGSTRRVTASRPGFARSATS